MNKLLLLFATLFTAIITYGQARLDWARQFDATSQSGCQGLSILTDHSGSVVTVGVFRDSVDFDPGWGVYRLHAAFSDCIFVSKLDSNGSFVWAKTLSVSPRGAVMDDMGNIYITGLFNGTVDVDPGAGVYNLVASGTLGDIFLIKLDPQGNFVWANNMPADFSNVNCMDVDGAGNVYLEFNINAMCTFAKYNANGTLAWVQQIENIFPKAMALDGAGHLGITGRLMGTADFDPGSGTYLVTPVNDDNFVCKFDTSGNLLWAYAVAPNPTLTVTRVVKAITFDSAGALYLTGCFDGTMDFDHGAGVYNMTSNGSSDVFLLKLSTAGVFEWAKAIGGIGIDDGRFIRIDDGGDIVTAGYFADTVDFDPGIGVENMIGAAYANYICKYNASGDIVFAEQIEGEGFNMEHLSLGSGGHIYCTGVFYDQPDFDPSAGVSQIASQLGATPVIKWKQDSCGEMGIVVDTFINMNCVNLQGLIQVHGAGGMNPYFYQWSTVPAVQDSLLTILAPGAYNIVVTDSLQCSAQLTFLMNAPSANLTHDLNVNIANGPFTPGMATHIILNAFNNSCIPISGTLKIELPSQVSFDSTALTPDLIVGNTLSWNFSNLTADDPHITPYLFMTTSATASLGDSLCFTVTITPIANDADTSNNIKTYCLPILGSFDPNDKHVYPRGACDEGFVLPGTTMTYTVNFQNTGTAEAFNIYLLDSLDADLDLNTIKVVGNSHPMYTEVLPGNVLKFHFDNIHLPDSNTNEPASHGYVIYEIQHKTNITMGSEIKNKAAIYFDYNAPVITNEVKNTVVATIPACVTDIEEISMIAGIVVYPNPAFQWLNIYYSKEGTFEIMDMTGKLVQTIILPAGVNNVAADISEIASGVYVYRSRLKDGTMKVGKLTVVR